MSADPSRSAAGGRHVLVLAGGLSHERDVSLRSGRRISEALRAIGAQVELRDVDATLLPALAEARPEAVFPVLHGAAGEDGSVREVLESLGLPYVGSRPAACRAAIDKPVAKAALASVGLASPASVTLPHETFRELGAGAVLEAVVAHLGLPLFVKPARGGSALGAGTVHTADELPAAMVACFAYGESALVERLVEGVEVAVSVVEDRGEPRALPAVEIVPDGGVYDYAARYTAGSTEFFVPARLEDAVRNRAETMALNAHRALGLRDLSRTDLIVTADGTPWFLEVNVAPGLTETSLLPQSAAEDGTDLGVLCGDLVERAIARGPDRADALSGAG